MPTLPTPPSVIIFDFDGVILDSARLKLDAYLSVYAGEAPDKLRQVKAYAELHGGITRRTKFIHYERELFGRAGDPQSIDRLCRRYADAVYQGVLQCPFVAGAEALLRKAEGKVKMHVVSGTPETELVEIVKARGLAPFFRSVRGAPATKPQTFAQIVAAEREPRDRILAVGDSMTEYLAAREVDIAFLGIVSDGVDSLFPPEVPVRSSLLDADTLLGIR